jgi:DNA-binding winged helix-turn-helix (wHTH) protein
VGHRTVEQTQYSPPDGVVRFGAFEVRFATNTLLKDGARIPLPRQLFRILAVLVGKSGEIVTRETIRQSVWAPDIFVDFEHNLNSAIKQLRKALGDSRKKPQYIETIPGVGYRFVASVERAGEEQKNK